MEQTEEQKLAESIKHISRGVKRMFNSDLNEKSIIILIHANCLYDKMSRKPSKSTIRNVIKSMETLEEKYCKEK